MIRAVLDTNLFVSMAIRPGGTPDQIRLACRDGRLTLLAWPPLPAEIQRVLAYPRRRALIRISHTPSRCASTPGSRSSLPPHSWIC